MKIEVNVYIHGDAATAARLDDLISLVKGLKDDMALSKQEALAAIAASTAEVKQHVTDAGARVTTTVNALTQEIADLQAKVGEPLTQADVDAIVAAQKDVITAADSVDPTTPPPLPIPPVTP